MTWTYSGAHVYFILRWSSDDETDYPSFEYHWHDNQGSLIFASQEDARAYCDKMNMLNFGTTVMKSEPMRSSGWLCFEQADVRPPRWAKTRQ